MKALELNDLEKEIIDQCNKLANPHNLTVGKFKIKRSIKSVMTTYLKSINSAKMKKT